MPPVNATEELNQIAARLYERRSEGVILEWADVSISDWRPQENECHANATIWCQHNTEHQTVRGWLYFPFEDLLNYVLFNPHSAIRTEDNRLWDITPSKASQQYPFIVAEQSEEEYAALVQGHAISRLVHIK